MSEPRLERFARAVVHITPPEPIGMVDGMMLVRIPLSGGRFEGELTADILPGGADWLRQGTDGRTIVDARYALRTDDGTVIQVLNQGSTKAVVPGTPMWAHPSFTAPEGPHDWLNHGAYVSAISSGADAGSIVVEYFRVV
jgi:hypothetical protein